MSETLTLQDTTDEAVHMLTVCNACRYCEGYCAVFQDLTNYRMVDVDDIDYFANLCHHCTACLHACQYKPPHEFGIDIPRTLTVARQQSYADYAWPQSAGKLFARHGVIASVLTAACLTLVLGLTMWLNPAATQAHTGPGAFYAVIPHGVMATTGLVTFGYALLAMLISALRYGRSIGVSRRDVSNPGTLVRAARAIASMRHLGGGHGEGCNETDSTYTNARRYFHQATMWGFLLCFAATCVATLYEYGLGRLSPFPYTSLPVVLGSIGGMGLLIGPAGLAWLRWRRAEATSPMDWSLLLMLFTISLTGFALMLWRDSSWMGALLAVHLGFVLAFFLTLPYGKFVHGVYRGIALVKFARDNP